MKGTLLQAILMTIIAVVSLSTEEKRADLLEGNLLLSLILVAFIVSWVRFFLNRNKKKVE